MKTIVLTMLNVGLVILFIYLLRKRELLSYHHQGRWWLTWLAIGVITLMDEFFTCPRRLTASSASAPSSLLPSPAC